MGGYAGPTGIFINNKFVPSVSGKTFATLNPADASLIAQVAEGEAKDIDAAVQAAEKAFQKWKKMPGSQRGALLQKLANLVQENTEELAQIESMDNGMAINLARSAITDMCGWLRYFAGYADKISGSTIPQSDPSHFSLTLLEPIGVVGAIVPWNFPLVLLSWKLAPALACGNTMVVKPSEKTPLSALKFAELVVKAGFPPGVVNIVPGYGPTAGDALARHNKVRKITFTGSVLSGKAVLKASAESNLKRVTLELGGKSPVIVCEDCDLDEAAFFAYNGIFVHQGQFCAAGSRVFVQDTVYDQFVEKAVQFAKNRLENIGNPNDENTELGPVVDEIQFKRVTGLIEKGKQEGAKVAFGGQIVNRPGYYVEPTVFVDVKDEMTIAKEEIFGPVQSILKFSDLKDAIRRANDTEHGLAAGVFTKDAKKAIAIAKELEAGTIWVNTYAMIFPGTPFGGFKQSGIGREGGEAVLKEYLQTKTVTLQIARL